MDFKLKSISPEGLEAALSKAEVYRFLNEPEEAESICQDVLATLERPAAPPVPLLNNAAWRLAKFPLTRLLSIANVGLLPQRLPQLPLLKLPLPPSSVRRPSTQN